MSWGWGRRPAAAYLLLGLPLLSFLYLRFDLVAVALAAWSLALLARRRESARRWRARPRRDGEALAVGAGADLRVPARRAAGSLAGVGRRAWSSARWWYLTGGPKAPFQVLSFRDARRLARRERRRERAVGPRPRGRRTERPTRSGSGTPRVAAKAVLFAGLLVVEVAIWRRRRARRARRRRAGPRSRRWRRWRSSRRCSRCSAPPGCCRSQRWRSRATTTSAIPPASRRSRSSSPALVALVWRDQASVPASWVGWLVLARNLVWIESWCRGSATPSAS